MSTPRPLADQLTAIDCMNTLTLTPECWMDGLTQSCDRLRHAWSVAWPGLDAVAAACSQTLDLHSNADPAVVGLCSFMQSVCLEMERRAAAAPQDEEPAYHNRLHTADVLVGLTTLLHAQHAGREAGSRLWSAALLAAAAAHDFGHPGGVNQQRFDFESRSWAGVCQYAGAVPPQWREHIESLILRTDPQVVPDNHQQVMNQPFSWDRPWCQVLLNEADILLSATSRFGPGLSTALAREWQRCGFAPHATVATPQGRAQFLRSVRFSSPAALALGMAQEVQEQLQSIAF